MPKVFISYARDESHGENLAAECQQELQGAGFEVFRDVIGLKPGDVWYRKLEFELETSDVVVLIISEKVRRSKWVHNEISMAEEIGLSVVPVLAESVRSPLWLRHLQSLDFVKTKNWPTLIETIELKGSKSAISNSKTEALTKVTTSLDVYEVDEHRKIDLLDITASSAKGSLIYENELCQKTRSWADAIDYDGYGIYADLDVSGIIQRFRLIQPGVFWMGSLRSELGRLDNETRHLVTLSKSFWLADTACTQAFWKAVMNKNPAKFRGNNNPVEQVSWNDVNDFIYTLNANRPGLSAHLPTEAQWEYACRSGTDTPFSLGKNITLDDVNYAGGRVTLEIQKTIAVKSFKANSWGVHEMHGNVFEWCQDAYGGDLGCDACIDPIISNGAYRVLRGGSWFSTDRYCRSAYRRVGLPNDRYDNVGFRLALAL